MYIQYAMETYSDELIQFIEMKQNQPRPISPITMKKYIQSYLYLTDSLNKEGNWITEIATDKLVRIINNFEVSATGILNYLNLFIMFRHDTLDLKILLDLRDKYNKRRAIDTKAKILFKKDTLPSHDEVDKWISDLYTQKHYTQYLINYLIWTYGFRNRDVNLIIITNENFKKTDTITNYAIIRRTDSILLINNYKTANSYGVKKIVCRSRRVLDCLNKLKEGALITNKFSEPVNDSNLNYYINLYTHNGVELGEADYLKIKLNWLQTQPNSLKNISKLCSTRGTLSIDTINNYYNINV